MINSIPSILILTAIAFALSRRRIARVPSGAPAETPEIAQAFTKLTELPFLKIMQGIFVKQIMADEAKGVCVDIGCGPGTLIANLANKNKQMNFIGIDLSDEMLKIAKINIDKGGLNDRVKFIKGLAENVPLLDSSVDLVVSEFFMHEWNNVNKALEEAYRILKPQGKLMIFDLRRDTRIFMYGGMFLVNKFIVPTAMKKTNEPIGSAMSSYTPGELTEMLSNSKFKTFNVKSGEMWISCEVIK